MSSVTMTSAYNKKGKNCTRVGNWVEELALKDMTGHDRFLFASPPPSPPPSLLTLPVTLTLPSCLTSLHLP
jgi:hypothetical protein